MEREVKVCAPLIYSSNSEIRLLALCILYMLVLIFTYCKYKYKYKCKYKYKYIFKIIFPENSRKIFASLSLIPFILF
jgi:hypothetical protein